MIKGTVLITGITGFIGSHIASMLEEHYPHIAVIGVDRVAKSDKRRFIQIDLLDRESIKSLINDTKPDFVFHMAGVVNSKNWQELYQGNVESTINLLEAVKEAHFPIRVIIPGSAAEYGSVNKSKLPISEDQAYNPVSAYGVTKVWQTAVAIFYAQQGVDVVVGRLFNVIGAGVPESLSLGAFASQLRKIKSREIPPEIRVGNLKPKRDFLDMRDIYRAFVALAVAGERGEIYNICSGQSVSMEYILNEMIEKSGVTATVVVDQSRVNLADIQDIYGSNGKLCRATTWAQEYTLADSVSTIVLSL